MSCVVVTGVQTCAVPIFGGGESFVSALSKTDQARMQQAAFHAGVRTPEVMLTVGVDDGLAEGLVSRFVEGETLGQRIVGDARYASARRVLPPPCAGALAAHPAPDTETHPTPPPHKRK